MASYQKQELPAIRDIREEQQVVTARCDLEITHRLQLNRIKDLDLLLASRDRIHTCNIWLTYLFHAAQAFGVFTVAICQSLDLGQLVFVGVGLNILASVFEAIRQFNTKMSIKKLKDIDAIRRGEYVDEGDVDVGQDRQERQRSDQQQLRDPERAVLYKYQQYTPVQRINAIREQEQPRIQSVQSVKSVKSVQSADTIKTDIKKIDQAIGDEPVRVNSVEVQIKEP